MDVCVSKPKLNIAEVIIEEGIAFSLDYEIPTELNEKIKKGTQVLVPVRNSIRKGFVVHLKDSSAFKKLSKIKDSVSSELTLPEDLVSLATWMSRYYQTPLFKTIRVMLPGPIRKEMEQKEQYFVSRLQSKEELRNLCINLRNKYPSQANVLEVMLKVKKGLFLTELCEQAFVSQSPIQSLIKKGALACQKIVIDRSPLNEVEYFPIPPKKLTGPQKKAFDIICSDINTHTFNSHVLYGVTGSGKTEVYLQTIAHALSLGKSAIVLVPEISLTTQTIERFKTRFTCPIAILHCRLSAGERRDQWQQIREGKCSIVIGARSAIFAPVKNLGLVIVDEEHEQSYKSEEMPTYHGRDIAVVRAQLNNCPVVLGSATPTLETYLKAKEGKYILSVLNERADGSHLPKITVVDMKKEYEKNKGFTLFSDSLLKKIDEAYTRGEQSLLFLNRRGYHTSLLCTRCGKAEECSNCSVTLSYHKNSHTLRCHLCGHSQLPPRLCSHCKSDEPLKFRGVGTEQVERALKAIFPEIRTLRMDADTTRHKGSHEKLFHAFRSGKADVLIGTQMIAKGLHFPEITLVGILNHDSSLHFPDFRAGEYTFQVLTQVAGRAGRGQLKGNVVIQTCLPDHPLIQLATTQDFPKFFEEEIISRQLLHFPPYTRLVKLVFTSEKEDECIQWGQIFSQQLTQRLPKEYQIHQNMPCGYLKIKGKFRYQCLIRGPNPFVVNKVIASIDSDFQRTKNLKVHIDVDPVSTFF